MRSSLAAILSLISIMPYSSLSFVIRQGPAEWDPPSRFANCRDCRSKSLFTVTGQEEDYQTKSRSDGQLVFPG